MPIAKIAIKSKGKKNHMRKNKIPKINVKISKTIANIIKNSLKSIPINLEKILKTKEENHFPKSNPLP